MIDSCCIMKEKESGGHPNEENTSGSTCRDFDGIFRSGSGCRRSAETRRRQSGRKGRRHRRDNGSKNLRRTGSLFRRAARSGGREPKRLGRYRRRDLYSAACRRHHSARRSAARTGRRIVSFPKGAQAGILHAEREVPGAEQTEARVCGRSCKRKEEKREERHAWRMPLFRGKDIPFAPAKELSDSQILTPGSESGSGRQNRGRTTWWPWRASHPRSWPCPWT